MINRLAMNLKQQNANAKHLHAYAFRGLTYHVFYCYCCYYYSEYDCYYYLCVANYVLYFEMSRSIED